MWSGMLGGVRFQSGGPRCGNWLGLRRGRHFHGALPNGRGTAQRLRPRLRARNRGRLEPLEEPISCTKSRQQQCEGQKNPISVRRIMSSGFHGNVDEVENTAGKGERRSGVTGSLLRTAGRTVTKASGESWAPEGGFRERAKDFSSAEHTTTPRPFRIAGWSESWEWEGATLSSPSAGLRRSTRRWATSSPTLLTTASGLLRSRSRTGWWLSHASVIE